jgi:hypothetical protein
MPCVRPQLPSVSKRIQAPLAVLVAVLLLAGCDKLKPKPEPKPQEATTSPGIAKPVVQEPPSETWCEVTVGGTMYKARFCQAKLLLKSTGGPAVQADDMLQVATSSESERHFPDVFIQAKLPGEKLAALIGQSAETTLFAKLKKDGPVVQPIAGEKIELKLTASDGTFIEGELTGQIQLAGSGKRSLVAIRFKARVEID